MSNWEKMTDDFLKNFVPDVYQEDIYAIDYTKLREKGIELITFDLDETIAPKSMAKPPRAAIVQISVLKEQGFKVWLLSNTSPARVKKFAERMGVEYIARAKKPSTEHFQEIKDNCGLRKDQMAHVGNSIMNDVAGGKSFGITTCLVRRCESHSVLAVDKKLEKELEKRGLWHKHHKEQKEDQYYQLGERQRT